MPAEKKPSLQGLPSGSRPDDAETPSDARAEAEVTTLTLRAAPADRLKVVTAFKPSKRTLPDDRGPEEIPDVEEAEEPDQEEDREVVRGPAAQRERFRVALPKPRIGVKLTGAMISFIAMVVLPIVATTIYLYFIAAPQYASEFRFSVRSQELPPAAFGTGQNLPASQASSPLIQASDNYIIINYLASRDVVEKLVQTLDFDKMYGSSTADFLTRLSSNASTEDKIRYWQNRISTSFDISTGIATVQVRAFSPTDAYQVAKTLVSLSEQLINDMQERARQDAIKFFEFEVSKAELRLQMARNLVRDYRNKQQITTPTTAGESLFATISKLELDLAAQKAELGSVTSFLKRDAPSVQVIQGKIKATEDQLTSLKAQIGSTDGKDTSRLSGIIANFEELEAKRAFAQKLYESAVTSLEVARANAAMQHSYVATFVQPKAAEASGYPLKMQTIFLVTLGALFVWFVVLMAGYAVRDHAI